MGSSKWTLFHQENLLSFQRLLDLLLVVVVVVVVDWLVYFVLFWVMVSGRPKPVSNSLSSSGWPWTLNRLLLYSKCWNYRLIPQLSGFQWVFVRNRYWIFKKCLLYLLKLFFVIDWYGNICRLIFKCETRLAYLDKPHLITVLYFFNSIYWTSHKFFASVFNYAVNLYFPWSFFTWFGHQ